MHTMTATKARANLFKIMAFVNDNSEPGMTESLIKGKKTPLEDCLSEYEVGW